MRSTTGASPTKPKANTTAPSRGLTKRSGLIRTTGITFEVNEGSAYGDKGRYDRAIEDDNQAIRLNPNYATAFHESRRIMGTKDDLQHALAELKKFSELSRPDPDGPKAVERVTKALSGR